MSTSNTKRPNSVGEKSSALVPQVPVSAQLAETELDGELCDQFAAWLAPELEALVRRQAAYITPASLRRSLRQR